MDYSQGEQMEKPQLQWSSPSRVHGLSSHWRDPSVMHPQLLFRPAPICQKENSKMIFNFTAKKMFSYDDENSSDNISDEFTKFPEGLMSFPLNIPGTTYHKCLKSQKKVLKWMKDMVKERRASPAETRHGDLLDQVIDDMKTEKFLDEDFIVKMIFAVLFAAFESTSGVLALAFKLLADHPSVLQELTAKHEAILKNRKDKGSSLTWDEYKSMTFTLQVINETFRLANVAPGLLRKVLTDVQVNVMEWKAGAIKECSEANEFDIA
ncbi:hypothetical protein L1049_014576 [Liquidambar formosana]|uniref:Cytochrome P450 n=1 Tax=Liquidambar formosana TaxID=63359 RepID=A0AAP0X0I6_LIQFO